MYEGAPDHPEKDRFWAIIERHKVTILYTAPTAIRAFMRWGDELPKKHDLSSLRLLGSVGEPINPEAWMWYHEIIGGGRCPIVDTWWQTETGAIMMTPLPGRTPDQAGQLRAAVLRRRAEVVKRDGTPCAPNEGGFLVIKKPWPSMLRRIYGDPRALREARTGQRDPGRLLHRRRRAPGRGRLLLGDGPRRRRAERRRPPPGHGGDRERAGVAPGGRRGRRGRAAPTS